MESLKIEHENVRIHQCDDWLKGRQNYIGGSESFALGATILEAPFKWNTPFMLWCEKRGIHIKKTSKAMQYGKERKVALREETDRYIHSVLGQTVEVFRSPYSYVMREYPCIGGNIDGLVRAEDGSISGLEIKTGYQRLDWECNLVPLHYWNQVQHYMLVLGLAQFYIVAEVSGSLYVRVVKANKEYQQKLLHAMVAFWKTVESGERPSTEGLEMENPYIQLLGETVDVFHDADLERLGAEYIALRKKKEEIEEKKSYIANVLKHRILPGQKFEGKIKVSWKTSICEDLDRTALKRERPEVFQTYAKKRVVQYLNVRRGGDGG